MAVYVPLQRRRREGATDFRARKRAVTASVPLLTVRVSNKNVSSQFVKPQAGGDVVLGSAHSRQLRKLGWKGSLKSTPACYLLGLVAGKKALDKGIKEAVVYNGTVPFIKGSRIAAFVKGVVDAGVVIPVGEGVFPSEERLTGKSISEHALKLSKEDEGLYRRIFSLQLKEGFDPTDYPEQFSKMKAAILGGSPK